MMKFFICAALTIVFLVGHPSQSLFAASERPIFKCDVRAAFQATREGQFQRMGLDSNLVRFHSPIIIDTSTGAVRLSQMSNVLYFRILQKGSRSNDFVLIGNWYDVMRIKGRNNPITFTYADFDSFYSGVCKKLS